MRGEAATSPHHLDPALRGRRYAIPFQQVWTAALRLASTTRGWELVDADDQMGVLRAEVHPLLFGAISDVDVVVRLDADAQTRVDLLCRPRKQRLELGRSGRRIRRFLRGLDRTVGAAPGAILPPHEGAESLPELVP